MSFNKTYIYLLGPIFFAAATLALSLVAFTSDGNKVRYVRLDFADKVYLGGNSTLTAIKPYGFVVGNFGYRPFLLSASGKPVPDLGLTSSRPFWFDILDALNSWFGSYYYGGYFTREHSSITLSDLPTPIADYNHVVKSASIAHWVMLCIIAGFSGILILFGPFSSLYSVLRYILPGIAIVNGLLAITAAALITGMFSTYCKRFNDYSDSVGITGSIQASGMGVEWGMAAASLLCAASWVTVPLMAARSVRQENEPVLQEPIELSEQTNRN